MIRFGLMTAAAAMLGMTTAAPGQAQKTNDAAKLSQELGGGMKGKKLAKAIEVAEQHPLGSRNNPVRADMPQGERAYLARLRCTDGNAPEFERHGNAGRGPYGYLVDVYEVRCAGQAPVTAYIDMYHVHVEERALPGFTIVAP